MTFDDFATFQKELFDAAAGMSSTKGKEYSNGEDRFGNFVRLANRLGIKREQVLYVYLTKHLDGIESRIVRGHILSSESTYGRILDAITYLTLLAGMLEEDERVAGHTVGTNGNTHPGVDAAAGIPQPQLIFPFLSGTREVVRSPEQEKAPARVNGGGCSK